MKYTITAAVLFSLVACQNDDEFAPAYENDANAVIVEATANGIQTRVNTEDNGSTWQNTDKFKVRNISANAITGKKEATYVHNGTTFGLDGDAYMVWADGENEFQAWFPADAAYAAFTLPSTQSTVGELRAADWMTATHKLAKPADKKLPLAFNHRLCKVTVTIGGYNTQYTGTETVSAPVFSVPTTPTEGTGVTVQGSATTVSGYMGDASAVLNAKPTLTAILMPGTYTTNDTFLTLTVGGDDLTVKASGLLTEAGLEAAKAYTFNLIAGKNQLTISSVSVENWGEGGSLTGGIADETQP